MNSASGIRCTPCCADDAIEHLAAGFSVGVQRRTSVVIYRGPRNSLEAFGDWLMDEGRNGPGTLVIVGGGEIHGEGR